MKKAQNTLLAFAYCRKWFIILPGTFFIAGIIMTKLEISRLSKSYTPGKPVLKPLDLTVEGGEMFFLLGPSGCGKSTLLRILAGLIPADSGSIRFNGEEVSSLPPEKRMAAMVFQNYALWPHLTVFENTAFGLRAAGIPSADIKKEVRSALQSVQLAGYDDRKIQSLSGGQQQRVALARALAVRPALLLLDEPLSNLDAGLRDDMRLEIRRIAKERKLTALYVTHDRREALSMADRIAVMNNGIIEQIGTPEELYRRPVSRFAASFLGEANFIPGKIMYRHGRTLTIDTGIALFQTEGDLDKDTEVTIMLRPESLFFTDHADAANSIPVTLEQGVFLGDHREWECRTGTGKLLVKESNPPVRSPGSRLTLAVHPGDINIIMD